jgi:hypothetical protein
MVRACNVQAAQPVVVGAGDTRTQHWADIGGTMMVCLCPAQLMGRVVGRFCHNYSFPAVFCWM